MGRDDAMSDNHQDLTSDRFSTVKREALRDKVPGLWTFIVLIFLMAAMGVAPTLRKRWEAETTPTIAPDTTSATEQALRGKLKAKADTQVKQLANDPK
jgi:hypothetical protein